MKIIERIIEYRMHEHDWNKSKFSFINSDNHEANKDTTSFMATTNRHTTEFNAMKDKLFKDWMEKEFGKTVICDKRGEIFRIRLTGDTSPMEEQFVFILSEENPHVNEAVIEMCKHLISLVYGGTCKFTGFGVQHYSTIKKGKQVSSVQKSWFKIMRTYA